MWSQTFYYFNMLSISFLFLWPVFCSSTKYFMQKLVKVAMYNLWRYYWKCRIFWFHNLGNCYSRGCTEPCRNSISFFMVRAEGFLCYLILNLKWCIAFLKSTKLLLKLYRFASLAPGLNVQLKTLKNIIPPETNRQAGTFNYETHGSRYVFLHNGFRCFRETWIASHFSPWHRCYSTA